MTRGIAARTSPGWRRAVLIAGVVVGLLCCVRTGVEGSENKQPRTGVPKSIVAFGDSITRGYGVPPGAGWVELLPGLLKKEFPEHAPLVFNAGGNGNTSSEGLARIEADVLAHMPGVVLVEFGGNDTVHTARGVSVDDFERNLLAIHKAVVGRGGSVVFLTFPPVINQWHSARSNPYYNKWGGLDQCVEQYRQQTREVAKRLGSPLFDLDRFLRERIKAEGRDSSIARDGVHLTPAANRAVAAAVVEFLQTSDLLRPLPQHPRSK